MTNIFSVDTSFIKSVDDETARQLVARLCRAELRGQGLPESAVTWGGDQRAKDGGVDVRVDCPNPLRMPNFVRTTRAAFQVKAENFPPSKIEEEMKPKGVLRPAIMELSDTGGSYIIVSTRDDCSDTSLQKRRDAITQCLRESGDSSAVQSDFYDSRRIADWVESHPPVLTWLRHRIGQPLKGWRPYGPWAYREVDPDAEYLVDEQVRVFVPGVGEGSCVTDAIAQLRQELKRTVSIRIVGLSGVGKTRLVQALFDSRVCPESLALTSENVIYTDLADEPEPQPQTMLERLYESGSDSIVVVDNCSPDTHERLTEIVKRSHSRLKLITVEYDIRDDLPEDTLCYRLDSSSAALITRLLKARYENLSDSDADRITEFSDGNARVAFALASTVETGGELTRLRNQALFERLFQQKNDPNAELLNCAEAASLLYSFDGEDALPDGEISLLASFVEVTPLTFSRHVTELERRGLLQRRGKWRAVLPHAIANGLAGRMLQSVPRDLLYSRFVEHGGERIARSFSRRLGFLHDCPAAVAMASQMFSGEGKLGDVTALSGLEQEMFFNLAPVDPRGALDTISRAMANDRFMSTDNHGYRSQYARVARSIAYEPELFDDATSIPKRFALVDPEGNKHASIREMLKSLFYCKHSGTQASLEQRRKVAKDLVSSCRKEERSLGLDLIEAALETLRFESYYGVEFGARRRDYGWYPRSQAEVKGWFRPWIEMVAVIGKQDNADGRKARAILGEAWEGLWGRVGLDDELADIASCLRTVDGWPEGWLGVRRVLQRRAQSLPPGSLAQLKDLEKTLAPSDLLSEIRARVLLRGRFAYDLDHEEAINGEDSEPLSPSEKHTRALVKVESLGVAAADSAELLDTLIPDLCSAGISSVVYAFGLGIGPHHTGTAVLLDAVRAYMQYAERAELSLVWIRGLLAGWREADPDAVESFLNGATDDVVWQDWFVELQVQSELDAKAFGRLLKVLDQSRCPTVQFGYLAMGRATDTLTVSQIVSLSNKLALRPDRGLVTALDLLAMVIHCADGKDEQYKRELGESLLAFLGGINWSLLNADHGQVEHDLNLVSRFALQRARSESSVASILTRILQVDEADRSLHRDVRRVALKPFFEFFPRLALEMVCVPDEDGTFRLAIGLISDPYSEERETALELVPKEVLLDWCNEQPEIRYVFAAGACRLFEKQDNEKTALTISDSAAAIFASAPDKSAVLEKFIRRFDPRFSSGSRADILETRLSVLDHLATNEHEANRSMINAAKARLQKWIAAERAHEREWMTSEASFE